MHLRIVEILARLGEGVRVTAWRQLTLEEWQLVRTRTVPAAQLSLGPQDLTDSHSISFWEDPQENGLGPQLLAFLELQSGQPVVLEAYKLELGQPICVFVAETADRAKVATELLDALDLPPETVIWRPGEEDPASA